MVKHGKLDQVIKFATVFYVDNFPRTPEFT